MWGENHLAKTPVYYQRIVRLFSGGSIQKGTSRSWVSFGLCWEGGRRCNLEEVVGHGPHPPKDQSFTIEGSGIRIKKGGSFAAETVIVGGNGAQG